jgi:hypothetical protein
MVQNESITLVQARRAWEEQTAADVAAQQQVSPPAQHYSNRPHS